MRKLIISLIVFILCFILLFFGIQSVLHYRWANVDDFYSRNLDYAAQPSNSIDVLYFGSSEILTGIEPVVLYEEEGITGYNFAISRRSAIANYFSLLYTLKYQTPKLVVCDFSCMYDDNLPGEVEDVYRRMVECTPDKDLKSLMIKTICELDPEQSYLSWRFPLLRYHSMWNELEEANFTKDYVYSETYPAYCKGAYWFDQDYEGDMIDVTPDLWEYDEPETSDDFSQISIEYYDKFIEECHNRDIKVVAVLPPKISAAQSYAARWDAQKEYFADRDVYCLNYNTYEQFKKSGFNIERDYADRSHLNVEGSIRFSKILAQDLKSNFGLTDHRGDEGFATNWDDSLREFNKLNDERMNRD